MNQWRICWVCLCLVMAAGEAHAEWVSRVAEGIMGTRITVEVWGETSQQGSAAIDLVLNEMRRIDDAMSTYKATSEVSQVNAIAGRHPVKISKELFELLTRSVEFSRLTQGAFDITYASVGFMYDFVEHRKPDDQRIAELLSAVNYRHIKLDAAQQTVAFTHPAVRIDLGGIAKGYAVDQSVLILKNSGIKHALISAGGDSYVLGDHEGRAWSVGIRDPDQASRVIAKLNLSDAAFSTSGDYERYFDDEEGRVHHIINPATGHSASQVRSATIIASSAVWSDGLSKTAFVLGAEKALDIYSQLPRVQAVLVTPEGKVLYSRGLESRLQLAKK